MLAACGDLLDDAEQLGIAERSFLSRSQLTDRRDELGYEVGERSSTPSSRSLTSIETGPL